MEPSDPENVARKIIAASLRERGGAHRLAALLFLVATSFVAIWLARFRPYPKLIDGVFWQIENAQADPHGAWDRLGAQELLLQWIVVDGTAFVPGTGLPEAPRLPDWRRIAGEPWARSITAGLAGRFDETAARRDVAELAALSARLAALPLPFPVAGWYFPVEVDPTWKEAPVLAELLAPLPRPLWITVYDSANIGAEPLAEWLDSWLPKDIGVLFQDGVGVHAREPATARVYAEVLARRLGRDRLRVIVEAFRPAVGGGFRPATAAELRPQIAAYEGLTRYAFDGPHHLSDALVGELLAYGRP